MMKFNNLKEVLAYLKGRNENEIYTLFFPGSQLDGKCVCKQDGNWGVWLCSCAFLDLENASDAGDIALVKR